MKTNRVGSATSVAPVTSSTVTHLKLTGVFVDQVFFLTGDKYDSRQVAASTATWDLIDLHAAALDVVLEVLTRLRAGRGERTSEGKGNS